MKPILHLLSAILIGLIFSSCSLTRDVPEGEYLLNKVKIEIDDPALKSSMRNLVKQKENRRILSLYRFRLRFYSSFLFKKESKKSLRLNLGEPPVLYDSTSSLNTTRQMHAFLIKRGYYDNRVTFSDTIKREKSKKIRVTYHITTGEATKIAEVEMLIDKKGIETYLINEQDKSKLKVGNNLDLDVLDAERRRMKKVLQNQGYFFFTEDLFFYKVDTLKEAKKAYITYHLKEKPQVYFGDSVRVDPYLTYKIRNVYIRQDFGKKYEGILPSDTSELWGYQFVSAGSFRVKPKVISRSIFHHSEDFYKLENHENTYRRLNALNNFNFVNLSYLNVSDTSSPHIDCLVSLSPSKPASISAELSLTNTGGVPGINGTGSIVHRNIFGGAEMLKFTLYGGIEAQVVRSSEEIVDNTPFNTVEIGPELSLTLPKFLLPVDQNFFAKRFVPKTTITTSYNYQRRPDYTRNILNTGLIYSWRESKTKSHAIQPININQIKILKSDDFQKRLDSLGNASLKASYEDNFITSIMYNFTYNSQVIKKDKSYHIFRANIEFAGNLLNMVDRNFLNSEQDTNGLYLINDIPYAQYFRTYFEYIPNIVFNPANKLVTRTFIGVGIPYGNSFSMPFVKSFYGGGTNGIRAWEQRSLGPGSVSNAELQEANVDQIGDMKIEQNIEYRFRIIKVIEGAVFTDMGNIWYINNQDFSEAAEFQPDKLWKDLAIGAGIGLRLNFDYFIIRLDVGQRIKDPGSEQPFEIRYYPNTEVYNFAIGYPF